MEGTTEAGNVARWELYRLLGEPSRLRLLALAAEEELAIGELAELLGESQPNVSRHVKPLRQAGLLAMRKEGTRVIVRLAETVAGDPVVRDAVAAGRGLCAEDGSLARVHEVVRARDDAARAFFEQPREADVTAMPLELPAYLTALAPLIARRRLAVDVGTGEGPLLEVLAPVFERVIAVDRAKTQLSRARERLAQRGYANVELAFAELSDASFQRRVRELGGADAVFVSRVLHHVPSPTKAIEALAKLLAPEGALVVIDYVAHHDEGLREQQADLWLGFEPAELARLATAAGLESASVTRIPAMRCGGGADGHLDWQVLVARRPAQELHPTSRPEGPHEREP
ncbi:MAG: metalloregulator ArsR/SmtB family transcription factor [Polyangiales bacterium]